MKTPFALAAPAALLLLGGDSASRVAPPPASIVERFGLVERYTQCLLVEGTPFVATAAVAPQALLEAEFLARAMVGPRSEILRALGESGTRFVAMSVRERTCDVDEHADLYPSAYWNKRARGLGATAERPAVSAGEENLLGLEGDPYSTESIFIHEFGHAIHERALARVDPTFDGRLRRAYESALAAGLWKGTYAASNRMEYWAEGTQSWFDTNRANDAQHNDVATREELRSYDKALAALLLEVYGDRPWRYRKPTERKHDAHLAGFDWRTAPKFAWTPQESDAYQKWEKLEKETARRAGEPERAWLERSAAAGIATSCVTLGLRHRDGAEGFARDDREAVRWFQRAVDLGLVEAMDHLGWMIAQGRGAPRDEPQAVALYRNAAERGCAQAMWNLARHLQDGRGVGADPVQAHVWLTRAAARGHAAARKALPAAPASRPGGR